ncbi:hypothetical protein HJC23_010895 [Cyclotella cryptica]|uniref:Uncharacterized protein n=1 Tax=Cyclotella cryptica TaxID=29204 RepID=A0ABD3Q8P5_9STRA
MADIAEGSDEVVAPAPSESAPATLSSSSLPDDETPSSAGVHGDGGGPGAVLAAAGAHESSVCAENAAEEGRVEAISRRSNRRSVTFLLSNAHEEEKEEIRSHREEGEADHQHEAANISCENGWCKQRTSGDSTDIGAMHVDERAPNINLRFFRGLAARHRTRSQRARTRDLRVGQIGRQETAGAATSIGGNQPPDEMVASVRPISNIMLEQQQQQGQTQSRRFFPNSLFSSLSQSSWFLLSSDGTGSVLLSATLVEPLEYAVVKELTWLEKHAKVLLPLSVLVVIALIGSVTPVVVIALRQNNAVPTEMPSEAPSFAPSQDPRPTLQIVQERGHLLCGLQPDGTPELPFRRELCRAVAAVVLGNPDSYKPVDPENYGGRFIPLKEGKYDLQITGDTHSVQREIKEPSSGAGFTFSTPYYYDGASFNGNAKFVDCAYNQKRYEECSDLFICVVGSTAADFISRHFSPDFYSDKFSWHEIFQRFRNGTCNVVAGDRQATSLQMEAANLSNYVVGANTFTNEPLAIVTRSDETEWSDIVNFVLQALFFGERQGVVQNSFLCEKNAPTNIPSKLNYLNAVYCVGNYGELYAKGFSSFHNRSRINRINNGTEMLYVTPFGTLYHEDAEDEPKSVRTSLLHHLSSKDELNCGIINQNGCIENNLTTSKGLCGMSVSYCITLAASIYNGNVRAVNLTLFNDYERALSLLSNYTVDVLFGLPANLKFDFGTASRKGVTFSMPYYYGDETGK